MFGNLKRSILIKEQNLADAEKHFDDDPFSSQNENLYKHKVLYLT